MLPFTYDYVRALRSKIHTLGVFVLMAVASSAFTISPSIVRAAPSPSPVPSPLANSVTYDAQYDYMLRKELPRISAVEADRQGRRCYAGLERLKNRLRFKSEADVTARLQGPGLLDDRLVKDWAKLSDECLIPAANFPKEPWFAVDMGLWLGIASSLDHPALHELSLRWLTIAANDAYSQRNAVVTRNACSYLRLIARDSEFHCFPNTVAWAVAATTPPANYRYTRTQSDDGDEEQQMMFEQQQMRDQQYQEQMQMNNEAEFERERQQQNP